MYAVGVATTGRAALRRERERDLVAATRALFDERGTLDAPIEEIAKSVGIARGLIYRQFSSKEELYVLTMTDYLTELGQVLLRVTDEGGTPAELLSSGIRGYARFCLRYPAFLDMALSLMRGPATNLRDTISDSIWLRLGAGMAGCIHPLVEVLTEGRDDETFTVADPAYTANLLWTQVLGAMHLARIGVAFKRDGAGQPSLFAVDGEAVVASCVNSALATVGARIP